MFCLLCEYWADSLVECEVIYRLNLWCKTQIMMTEVTTQMLGFWAPLTVQHLQTLVAVHFRFSLFEASQGMLVSQSRQGSPEGNGPQHIKFSLICD